MSKQIKKKVANGTGYDKHRKGGGDVKQECSHTVTPPFWVWGGYTKAPRHRPSRGQLG